MKILLAFLLTFSAHAQLWDAHIVPWQDSAKEFYKCYTNRDAHPGISPLTLMLGCQIAAATEIGTLTITDSCGRTMAYQDRAPVSGVDYTLAGYHHGHECSAMDFYFDKWPSSDIHENARYFEEKLYQMGMWLEQNPWMAAKVGLGFYGPSCINGRLRTNGFIIHLDTRGKKARWGRVEGKYIPILDALDEFFKVVNNGCD